jgi:hypothetical protein
MIDSDNVMLLRALTPEDALPALQRDVRDSRLPEGLIVVIAQQVDHVDHQAIQSFRNDVRHFTEAGPCRTLGMYATEPSPNTFSRLPVRTDRSIVWFGASDADNVTAVRTIISDRTGPRWEHHVLIPTLRSALDATSAHTA